MQLEVTLTNEINIEILDEDFYSVLLKALKKDEREILVCACLDTSENKNVLFRQSINEIAYRSRVN